MAYFICPNCGNRSIDADGRDGLTHQAAGCGRCGFGFLFQLIEDFYPPAGAGMLACDKAGRVLACGRGVFELTGYREGELLGRDVRDALGLRGVGGDDPVGTVLEWGVRKLDQRLLLRHAAGLEKTVRGDFFPGYDNDGGLLASLAPALS
jgi:PAS domain-containing protein